MTLISKAGYWKICGCGTHGHITLSSGEHSRQVCSRESALEELTRLRTEGKVTEHEITFLKSKIPSEWPRLTEDADMMALVLCEARNSVLQKHQEFKEGVDKFDVGDAEHVN